MFLLFGHLDTSTFMADFLQFNVSLPFKGHIHQNCYINLLIFKIDTQGHLPKVTTNNTYASVTIRDSHFNLVQSASSGLWKRGIHHQVITKHMTDSLVRFLQNSTLTGAHSFLNPCSCLPAFLFWVLRPRSFRFANNRSNQYLSFLKLFCNCVGQKFALFSRIRESSTI